MSIVAKLPPATYLFFYFVSVFFWYYEVFICRFLYLIIGMTIHQLIYELSVGIRLPNPEFCPPSISTMLRKCFHNDPTERPDFKEITDNVQLTFNARLNDLPLEFSNRIDFRPLPIGLSLGLKMTWEDSCDTTFSSQIRGYFLVPSKLTLNV